MTWLWWLLAPILSTLGGAGALCLRGRHEHHTGRRSRDGIREHRLLIRTLADVQSDHPVPVTMLVLGD